MYKLNKKTGDIWSIYVSGINPDIKGYVIQNFSCDNGVWSAYYNNGVVTYPKSDWRHGRVDRVNVDFDSNLSLWDFEENIREKWNKENSRE